MFGDWSSKEKEKYKKIRKKELGALFAEAGISIDEPEKRTIYLIERILNFSKEEYKEIEDFSKYYGKVWALNLLEQKVIDNFY